jgi:hypothetical protein
MVAVGGIACSASYPSSTSAVRAGSTTSVRTTEQLDDPFAGRALPPTGFIVLDDPKDGTATRPSSWSISLVDDAGTRLGQLPRATISDAVLNSPLTELVATRAGVRIEHRPLGYRSDDSPGCTTTGSNAGLRVGLCGARSGDQLLGDRVVVRRGSGWSTLISKPPVRAGDQPVGHWEWAAPSPDGRWVLAGWSAECEVQTALLVSVADGSVRAVTGETGTAWRTAPESGGLGWTDDGFTLAVFGGESGCGAPTTVPRGVYRVSPEDESRRLLVPLAPSQGLLRWIAAVDRRTP